MTSEPLTAELEIEKLVAGGRGLGHLGGRVWIVEGAMPGDRVRAVGIHERRAWVEARVGEILDPSPSRREPPCPLQSSCGGCPWMVLAEEAQRAWKRRLLLEALERLAGIRDLDVEPVVPSPRNLGYRHKVEMTFGREGDRPVLGFHAAGEPRRVVDVDRCLLIPPPAQGVLDTARRFFLEGPGRDDPALREAPEAVRLVIRCSAAGDLLVGLRGPRGPFLAAPAFAREVSSGIGGIGGVVRILARPGGRSGSRVVVLAGRGWIRESLGGNVFRVPAPAFFQINPEAAEQVVERVRRFAGAGPGIRVVELYGGVGVLGLALADRGAEVTICEADAQAVACGRQAAAGKDGVRFVHADAGTFLRRRSGRTPDVVVADPPRTGLGPGVVQGILALHPSRIVLVSCDPPTLARDLRGFVAGGYAPRRLAAIDLFPQTPHVEAVALLETVGS